MLHGSGRYMASESMGDNKLTSYIWFRYVGEEGLALESLSWLGRMYDVGAFRNILFWSQTKWLASACGFEGEDL